MRILFSVLVLIGLTSASFAQRSGDVKKTSIEQYIETYSALAKSEMRRTGVPASITLAQGILESNFGNSALAKKANNHFGIKCHKGWTGKGYYMDDDAKDECFRVYKSPTESFRDHSDFLKNRDRYAFLFKLDQKDYKGWAKGLQKAGYATNPKYSVLLIRIIEDRKLTQYDNVKSEYKKLDKESFLKTLNNRIFLYNGVKTVVSQPGDNSITIADRYQMNTRQILKYNDFEEGSERELIKEGSKIYLQPKKKKGYSRIHEVKPNENMRSISQKEGIKLTSLYKLNLMEVGEEAIVGERLTLRKKNHKKPNVKSEEQILQEKRAAIQDELRAVKREVKKEEKPKEPTSTIQPKERFVDGKWIAVDQIDEMKTEKEVAKKVTPTPSSTPTPPVVKEKPAPPALKDKIIKEPSTEPGSVVPPMYHTVQPKETLYKVSREYGVAVDQIKAWNNMKDNNLTVGQQLLVGYYNGAEKPTPAPPATKTPKVVETVKEVVKEPAAAEEKEKPIVEEEVVEKKKEEVKPDPSTGPPAPAPIVKEPTIKTPEVVEEKKEVGGKTHTVAKGETMFAIAKKYSISVNELKSWNQLPSYAISPGQVLFVEEPKSSTVKQAEPKSAAPNFEGLPASEVEKDVPTKVHTVMPGEGLYSISKLYDVSIRRLKDWNKLESDDISVGQQLIVGYE